MSLYNIADDVTVTYLMTSDKGLKKLQGHRVPLCQVWTSDILSKKVIDQ